MLDLALRFRALLFFLFTLVIGPRRSLSLKLSDTRVYEPQTRAHLGTTAHFFKVVVTLLDSGRSLLKMPGWELRIPLQVRPEFVFQVSCFVFRISGFWSRVSGFGFRVSGFGFLVSGFGFRISCFVFRVLCFVFLVSCFVFRVSCFVFRVSRFAFRVLCFVCLVSCFVFRVSDFGFQVSGWGGELPAAPDTALFYRNVQRFRGGLVSKAHRLLCHSTLSLRVIKEREIPL